jgi:hypothetical protein
MYRRPAWTTNASPRRALALGRMSNAPGKYVDSAGPGSSIGRVVKLTKTLRSALPSGPWWVPRHGKKDRLRQRTQVLTDAETVRLGRDLAGASSMGHGLVPKRCAHCNRRDS